MDGLYAAHEDMKECHAVAVRRFCPYGTSQVIVKVDEWLDNFRLRAQHEGRLSTDRVVHEKLLPLGPLQQQTSLMANGKWQMANATAVPISEGR